MDAVNSSVRAMLAGLPPSPCESEMLPPEHGGLPEVGSSGASSSTPTPVVPRGGRRTGVSARSSHAGGVPGMYD